MKAIVNATLVMPDYYIPNGVVFFDNGIIKGYGRMKDIPVPEECEVIDAGGLYVGPGLIDEHTHAGGVFDYFKQPVEGANFALSHGVTSVLPTLGYGNTNKEYVPAIKQIKEAMKVCPNIAGINMEGPFTNPGFGSHKYLLEKARPIVPEDYEPTLDEVKDLVKTWTIAPELEGILGFVKDAAAATPGVAFAVGHSEAAPWQVEALMPYGLRIATHHTDATGKYHAWPDKEILGVGVDEAVNFNSDIYAELICDEFGIHVAPYMLRLIRKIKSDDKCILISDSTYHPESVNPKEYSEVTDLNFDDEEEISGSKVTFDDACHNWMVHTGASVCETFKVASLNPSKALHLYDRGEIAEGKKADFDIVDDKMGIKKVIVDGNVLVEK